jgi:hypothetical protein
MPLPGWDDKIADLMNHELNDDEIPDYLNSEQAMNFIRDYSARLRKTLSSSCLAEKAPMKKFVLTAPSQFIGTIAVEAKDKEAARKMGEEIKLSDFSETLDSFQIIDVREEIPSPSAAS